MPRLTLRLVSVAVLASALLFAAGSALAQSPVKAGTFKGTTAQGIPITIKAGNKALLRLTTTLRLPCTDGATATAKVTVTRRAPYVGDQFRVINLGDETYRFAGTLKRRTIRGDISWSATYNDAGKVVPSGTPGHFCQVRGLKFTARNRA